MARLRYRPTSLVLRTLLRTLGADLRSVLAWLAFCGVLVAAIWVWTAYVISHDKEHIRSKLHATAAADARAYAEQLERSLSQVDYIMLSQKYHYEKAGGTINLEEQTRAGLVPPTSELIVTVVDSEGNPVSSTLPFKNNRTNIGERSYFREHKQQANLGLTIARPRMGLRLGREVLLLSRRLDGKNGLFAGLIVVAIEPAYLGSHFGAGSLEQDDLVAAYRADWAFLAGDPHTADIALGERGGTRAPLAGGAGTAEVAAGHYRDGKVRILAWRQVKGYPLFAAVALSEASRLAAYGEREHEMHMSALCATLAVLLAAAGGAAWLLWNASKKLQRQEARRIHRRFIRSGLGLAATIRDVSAARAHEHQLHHQANIDALTSLPNRFWLMKHLPAALDEARSAGSMLAVLFIDLDDFKNLNDTQGHAAGDELLRACARRLRGLLRQGDGVARLGGDEFTMILRAPGGIDEIAAVATRVIDQLRQPFAVGDGRHVVSASVGISVFPRDGEDGAALLKHADLAMYAAKECGKSQYSFFDARLSGRLVERLARQAGPKRAPPRAYTGMFEVPPLDEP
jgi:diguanylate cyclase (GGDEF)-like protein